MASALATFPTVDPVYALVIYMCVPLLPLLIGTHQMSKLYHWRGGWVKSFFCNVAVVFNSYAPAVAIGNILWATLILFNQGAFIYNNLSLSNDVTYYLRVDRSEYDSYNLILSSQALNSIKSIYFQTGLVNRRLTIDGSDALISIVYFKNDWQNLLTSENLINVCKTERNIRSHLNCLNSANNAYHSIIPKVFNVTTCHYLTSYASAQSAFGSGVYADYVSDSTMYSSNQSPILISYFHLGSCGDEYPKEGTFHAQLNEYAVNNTMITTASANYLSNEMRAASDDAQIVCIFSILLGFICLVLSVRGLIVAITTILCVIFSLLNAAALLPHCGYSQYSVVNSVGLLVLIAVGGSFVTLYGSAWRNSVNRGKNASPQSLIDIYITVAQGIILTTLTSSLSFFAIASSPVPFISQLGYYLALSMIIFLVTFHYIIIPVWILTSWYTIPSKFHNAFRLCRQQYCMFCVATKLNTIEWTSAMVFRSHGVEVHEEEEEELAAEGRGGEGEEDNNHVSRVLEMGLHNGSNSERRNGLATTTNRINVNRRNITTNSNSNNTANTNSVVNHYDNNLNSNLGRENTASSSSSSSSDDAAVIVTADQVRFASEVESRTAAIIPAELVVAVVASNNNSVEIGCADGSNNNIGGTASLNNTPLGNTSTAATDANNAANSSSSSKNNSNLLHWFRSIIRRGGGGSEGGGGEGDNTIIHVDDQHVMGVPPTTSNDAADDDVNGGGVVTVVPAGDACCGNRKAPLKIFGFVVLLLTLAGLLAAYLTGEKQLHSEYGNLSEVIPKGTNVYDAYYIQHNYRGDLLHVVDNPRATVTTIIATPTMAPTLSAVPTRRPTVAPTSNTFAPTTLAPSMQPTTATPTMSPTVFGQAQVYYTNYKVTGCWGMTASKSTKDGAVTPIFDYTSFKKYMDSGDIVQDMVSICTYVDNHRSYLNIHPEWNRARDCISDQYFQYKNTSATLCKGSKSCLASSSDSVTYNILKWGLSDITAAGLVGLESNATSELTIPVWVCANFTVQSDVRSFASDTSFGLVMQSRWESAFFNHAGNAAEKVGVALTVSSYQFTDPLLTVHVFNNFHMMITAILISFVLLLWLFTLSDFGLTIFGSLGVFAVLIITVFIGLHVISTTLQLGDITALLCLLSYLVSFPLQTIEEYISARSYYDRKRNAAAAAGAVVMIDENNNNNANNDMNFSSPALSRTNALTRWSLLGPLCLGILSAVPYLQAEYPILQRFGGYFIICAISSYLFSVLVQPYLLAFGCRTKLFESAFTYYDDDYDDGDDVTAAGHHHPPTEVSISNNNTITRNTQSTLSAAATTATTIGNNHHHYNEDMMNQYHDFEAGDIQEEEEGVGGGLQLQRIPSRSAMIRQHSSNGSMMRLAASAAADELPRSMIPGTLQRQASRGPVNFSRQNSGIASLQPLGSLTLPVPPRLFNNNNNNNNGMYYMGGGAASAAAAQIDSYYGVRVEEEENYDDYDENNFGLHDSEYDEYGLPPPAPVHIHMQQYQQQQPPQLPYQLQQQIQYQQQQLQYQHQQQQQLQYQQQQQVQYQQQQQLRYQHQLELQYQQQQQRQQQQVQPSLYPQSLEQHQQYSSSQEQLHYYPNNNINNGYTANGRRLLLPPATATAASNMLPPRHWQQQQPIVYDNTDLYRSTMQQQLPMYANIPLQQQQLQQGNMGIGEGYYRAQFGDQNVYYHDDDDVTVDSNYVSGDGTRDYY